MKKERGNDFIVFGRPDISSVEEKAVLSVMRSGWLGNGSVARQFEDAFEHFLGDNYFCVAVNSCTTGLFLSLKAEGIGEGHEVITSPLTFAATVNAILAVGAKPVFVDVDDDGCLDPNEVNKAVTSHTQAIIPVHLAGSPCDMTGLVVAAHDHGLKMIEDAAHAFGGEFSGQPLGTFGQYGVFSFYPTKNITCGDGGMVVTYTQEKADRIRIMASQGLTKGAWMRYGSKSPESYGVAIPGFKGLMNDMSAALGLAQLQRWPDIRKKRGKIWSIYEKNFGNRPKGHSQHLYTIQVDDRDGLRDHLFNEGIGTGIHYNPLHLEEAYQFLGYKKGDFPKAEHIGLRTLSLPISSLMSEEDAHRVVKEVKSNMWRGEPNDD